MRLRRAVPELSAADAVLLEAVGRRLAVVDDELPRLQPWRTDRAAAGQLHVVRGRVRRVRARPPLVPRRRRRVGIDLAAAVIAMAVLATGLIGNRLGDVGRPSGIAAVTPPGPAFSFGSPSMPAASGDGAGFAPSGDGAGYEPSAAASLPAGNPRPTPVEGAADPGGGLLVPAAVQDVLGRTGWRCAVLVQVVLDPLGSNLIEKLAVVAGGRGGFLSGDIGPGWIGSDPIEATRSLKGRLMFVDALGSAWMLRAAGTGPGGADVEVVQLVPERSAAGTTAWRSADVLWPVDCPTSGMTAKELVGSRGRGDWPTGQVVDVSIVRWIAPTTAPAGRPS